MDNSRWTDRCRDTVRLVKRNGQCLENIKANVHADSISIYDGSLQIEEGDVVERQMSNGLMERYVILDRGFREGSTRIGAHYQMTVRKETAIRDDRTPPVTHNYHLPGNNARVNVHSTDNSINVVGFTDADGFVALRHAINTRLEDDTGRVQLLARLDDMEQVKGTPEFGIKYRDFVGTVADHWSLLGPMLLALTQHLR